MKSIKKCLLILSLLGLNTISYSASDINSFDEKCRQGNGQYCYVLGEAYFGGDIVKRDIQKAREYLSIGCKAGNQQACSLLEKIK